MCTLMYLDDDVCVHSKHTHVGELCVGASSEGVSRMCIYFKVYVH